MRAGHKTHCITVIFDSDIDNIVVFNVLFVFCFSRIVLPMTVEEVCAKCHLYYVLKLACRVPPEICC